jgi:BolA protein
VTGPVQSAIRSKLEAGLAPARLEVVDESHMHKGPATETHFKVVVVSEAFAGRSPIQRHRVVHGLLAAELAGGVHALSIVALTPEQWAEREGAVPDSPPCRGGS